MSKPKAIRNQDVVQDLLDDERYQKNLLYCESWDMMYVYENGWYRDVPTATMSGLIWQFLIEKYGEEINVKPQTVKDVFSSLKFAIRRRTPEIKTPYIAFNDALYNLETFATEAFDRKKIALHHLDFKYEQIEQGETKLWMKFLSEIFITDKGETDEEVIQLFHEMLGYYMLNDLKAQKVFFLVGQGSNGKGVLFQILEEMIGQKFVSAMSVQTLTTNQFSVATLIGKKLNICAEEESKFMRSDRFKALISGDLIDVERKFEGRFAFKPTTKYVFSSNKMPTFDTLNYGLKRRMIIIPFNRVFKDHEQDKDLIDKLKCELPGILRWSLEGSKRLIKNKYCFTRTRATKLTEEEFENEISSPLLFIRENYTPDDTQTGSFISNKELYKSYVQWCLDNGKKPMASFSFHKEITQNLSLGSFVQWTGTAHERGRMLRVGGDDTINVEDGIDSNTDQ